SRATGWLHGPLSPANFPLSLLRRKRLAGLDRSRSKPNCQHTICAPLGSPSGGPAARQLLLLDVAELELAASNPIVSCPNVRVSYITAASTNIAVKHLA